MMVERVAAAIQAESVNKPWRYENAARAAIAAMRKMTPAMQRAGAELLILDADWSIMIDAALSETLEGER